MDKEALGLSRLCSNIKPRGGWVGVCVGVEGVVVSNCMVQLLIFNTFIVLTVVSRRSLEIKSRVTRNKADYGTFGSLQAKLDCGFFFLESQAAFHSSF